MSAMIESGALFILLWVVGTLVVLVVYGARRSMGYFPHPESWMVTACGWPVFLLLSCAMAPCWLAIKLGAFIGRRLSGGSHV